MGKLNEIMKENILQKRDLPLYTITEHILLVLDTKRVEHKKLNTKSRPPASLVLSRLHTT
jgi:hypothetical protein